MNHEKWSKAEEAVAGRALENGCERACGEIVKELRVMAGEVDGPDDVWRVHLNFGAIGAGSSWSFCN